MDDAVHRCATADAVFCQRPLHRSRLNRGSSIEFCKSTPSTICFYVKNDEKRLYEYYVKGQSVAYPAILFVRHVRGYHFRQILSSVENQSVTAISSFYEGLRDHTIPIIMRSQKPVEGETGPVKTVVGSDFVKRVMESDGDCVVAFYSGYCDHCSKVMKRFEKVGQFFKEDKGLWLFKYNSQENDLDVEEISVGDE